MEETLEVVDGENPSSIFRCDGNRYKWFNQLRMTAPYKYLKKSKGKSELNQIPTEGYNFLFFSQYLKNRFPYFTAQKKFQRGNDHIAMRNVCILMGTTFGRYNILNITSLYK